MPIKTSYSEPELATFMLDALGPMQGELGWTGVADVQAAINQTLRDMGVQASITEVSGAAECGKLEAFARRAVWDRVVDFLAVEHDFSKDGQKFDRSQLQEMAKVALAKAETRAALYDDSELIVGLQSVEYTQDPYAYTQGGLRAENGREW